MDKFDYESAAKRIIDNRIEVLRKMTFGEAEGLPEVYAEDQIIAGEKASLTIFRHASPYQLEGKVLVVVLAAREALFGTATHHIECGLVFSQNEEVREATEIELQNSGG